MGPANVYESLSKTGAHSDLQIKSSKLYIAMILIFYRLS
jgi:hypothetical protein